MLVLLLYIRTIMGQGTKLHIASFNCKNVKSSLPELYALCNMSDLVLLQETWLSHSEVNLLQNLHDEFYADAISSFRDDALLVGRPHGGLAILWRKKLAHHLKVEKYDDPRILGINLCSGDSLQHTLILNVYLPCDTGSQLDSNYDEFMNTLGKVLAIVQDSSALAVHIVGDFNACFKRKTLFGKELITLCDENHLIISDSVLLPRDSFTFLSDAHHSTSWIDHCVSSPLAHQRICDMDIRYEFQSSDHYPLMFTIHVPVLTPADSTHSFGAAQPTSTSVCWQRATDDDIMSYRALTTRRFVNIRPPAAISCSDVSCTNDLHRREIDTFYRSILDALHTSASLAIPSSNSNRHQVIPGWNDLVREKHAQARASFLLWVRCGKPRQGEHHRMMSRDRAAFKLALRHCRRHEAQIRADKLAQDLMDKDVITFWRDVQRQSCMRVPLAESVNGVTGQDAIANMWALHYDRLFNSVSNAGIDTLSSRISALITDNPLSEHARIYDRDVEIAIKQLKRGKAVGPDRISAEHYMNADRHVLCVLLSLCFNSFLVHGYLPNDFMISSISPVLKDKTGDVSDTSNYRPIALTSVASKILERIILSKSLSSIESCDNQFGFKSMHSTDLCIYALKETVNYYISHSTPVFACFMDASKAFDRVSHCFLFRKLLDRNFPLLFLRILIFWYVNQQMCVRWGNAFSHIFSVSNGVRQGGVLSPYLFNVYVDGLSMKLNRNSNGCMIGNVMINHFFYADDLVLICPSLNGLQKLVDICSEFSTSHEIVFNSKKTVCMSFLPSSLKFARPFKLLLQGQRLSFKSDCKYLGVFLCDDRTDDLDLNRQLRSFYVRCNYLMRNFNSCSQEVKCLLFNTFCGNFYSGHCWSSYKRASMSKLVVGFNNSFRRLMSYPRFCSASSMYVFNHVCSFNEILRKSIYSFRERILNSQNSIICTLARFTLHSPLWKLWHHHLFSF